MKFTIAHVAHVGRVFQSIMTTQGKVTSGDEVRMLTGGSSVTSSRTFIVITVKSYSEEIQTP